MARGPRITAEERKLMLQLDSEGWTQTRIANHTGRHTETVRKVLGGPKTRKSKRTKEEIAIQKAKLIVNRPDLPNSLTPTVSFEVLRLLMQMADRNPVESLDTIESIIDLFLSRLNSSTLTTGRRKKMRCMAVQAQAIYASTLRSCGRFEEARIEIELLIEETRNCLECQEDLYRRLVYILISMNQLELAQEIGLSSIALCSRISSPGHDLHRLPNSTCLAALSTAYYHSNQFESALSTAFEAAKKADPKAHEIHYQQCISLIAYSCVHLNRLEDASNYVQQLVNSISDEVSVPAARAFWLAGVLAYLESQPNLGLFNFEQAIDFFKILNLENDVIACAMDHALLSGKTPEEIKRSISMISEYNDKQGRKEFPNWISKPLKKVMYRLYKSVCKRPRSISPIFVLRQTVREIRDFAGGDLMPVIS